MMFFTWNDVAELSRAIRRTPFEGVSEELRGWNYTEPPVAPTYSVKLGVSDIISGYCDTGRNVYVKYVLHARQRPNPILERGYIVHAVHEYAVASAKHIILGLDRISGDAFLNTFRSEIDEVKSSILSRTGAYGVEEASWLIEALWWKAGLIYSAQLERALSRSRHLSRETLAALVTPEFAEFPVDGTLVGLTPTLRVDSLLPMGLIVEIKSRPFKDEYLLALAGYALAFESHYEMPVDFGVMMQVQVDDKRRDIKFYRRIVPISDDLRSGFLERRDALAAAVAVGEDPGAPEACNLACPYLHVCQPSRVADRP